MKRKIAAIFAADIAGYSRLVAEDEEETLKVTGFFKAAGSTNDITRCPRGRGTPDGGCAERLERGRGWNGRHAGLGLKAATEQAAVDAALAECAKRDGNCQIIAIGPFAVGPN